MLVNHLKFHNIGYLDNFRVYPRKIAVYPAPQADGNAAPRPAGSAEKISDSGHLAYRALSAQENGPSGGAAKIRTLAAYPATAKRRDGPARNRSDDAQRMPKRTRT